MYSFVFVCVILRSFIPCKDFYSSHHNTDTELFHNRKGIPVYYPFYVCAHTFLSCLPFSCPCPLATTNLFSICVVLWFWYTNEITQYIIFWNCKHSALEIHPDCCTYHYFLLFCWIEFYPTDIPDFSYLPVERHLNCFQVFAITNEVVMRIVYRYRFSFLWGKCPSYWVVCSVL